MFRVLLYNRKYYKEICIQNKLILKRSVISFITLLLRMFTFVSNDDSLDWKNYGRENIINTVVNHKHLGNGSIILCHNGAKYTAQALDDMIKGLKEKGYEIVPISKVIYKKNYQMDHEGRQFVVGEEGKVTQ